MLSVESIQVGLLQVNCYLVLQKESEILYIIDPGGDAKIIAQRVNAIPHKRSIILLTHAHVDHISGVGELMKLTNSEFVFLHKNDLTLYKSPDNALEPYLPAAQNLPEPTTIFESEDIAVIPTPGHTQGGVCYYFPSENILFSGDTLFENSVGRTDLPGGNWEQLIRSIKENLLILPPETVVMPGHGGHTTIKAELRNPYIR